MSLVADYCNVIGSSVLLCHWWLTNVMSLVVEYCYVIGSRLLLCNW